MKSFLPVFSILLIMSVGACDKPDKDIYPESLNNTQWTLSKIIANETGEITLFPEQLDKFEIVFKQNGKIDLPVYCNYSFGKYDLIGEDSIYIYDVGPGTKKYCLPDPSMDWEILFINSLIKASTWAIEKGQLKIYCNHEYTLVFNYAGIYYFKRGKLTFCSNGDLLNCALAIEISINGEIVDTLDAESTLNDSDCQCDTFRGFGTTFNLTQGRYDYSADRLNCNTEDKVNSWSGEVNVIADTCIVVFLDVLQ